MFLANYLRDTWSILLEVLWKCSSWDSICSAFSILSVALSLENRGWWRPRGENKKMKTVLQLHVSLLAIEVFHRKQCKTSHISQFKLPLTRYQEMTLLAGLVREGSGLFYKSIIPPIISVNGVASELLDLIARRSHRDLAFYFYLSFLNDKYSIAAVTVQHKNDIFCEIPAMLIFKKIKKQPKLLLISDPNQNKTKADNQVQVWIQQRKSLAICSEI